VSWAAILVSSDRTALATIVQAPNQLPATAQSPTQATPFLLGAAYCKQCHSNPAEPTELCRMNEFLYWDRLDPHKIAMDWGSKADSATHKTEAARRAWEMGDRLKIEDVTRAPECIGCHSVVAEPVTTATQNFNSPTAEGVTCVACHGAFSEWAKDHTIPNDPGWRGLTRDQKWERAGMVDLWDPVVRASACVSCHIGDPDPGMHRQLTHAMYAAGHPPLPGFELASFTQEQPRHWQLLREKSPKIQDELHFDPSRLEDTEQVLAGGLVALRRTLELFETQAIDPSGFPEFARFDCVACHHDLDAPGATGSTWRQRRGTAGTPGRPVESSWPLILAGLALESLPSPSAAPSDRPLSSLLDDFHQALTSRPFGDPSATPQAARAIIARIDPVLSGLAGQTRVDAPPGGSRIDAPAALRLLRRIAEVGSAEILDYDTARQAAWAFRAIHAELIDLASKPGATDPTLASILASVPQARPFLADLDRLLLLSLRGNTPDTAIPANPVQQPLIDSYLHPRLDSSRSHDPDAVRRAFAGLASLLPPGPESLTAP
jgi:hypothetical protein